MLRLYGMSKHLLPSEAAAGLAPRRHHVHHLIDLIASSNLTCGWSCAFKWALLQVSIQLPLRRKVGC